MVACSRLWSKLRVLPYSTTRHPSFNHCMPRDPGSRRGLLQRPRPARHRARRHGLLRGEPGRVAAAGRHPCPRPPSPEGTVESSCYSDRYLVFDPTVSAHYQVLVLPHRFPDEAKVKAKIGEGLVEWPPLPWMIQVFSSSTQRWEDRSIVREGGEAIAAADLLQSSLQRPRMRHYYAACWHGALYLHFNDDFLVRYDIYNFFILFHQELLVFFSLSSIDCFFPFHQ